MRPRRCLASALCLQEPASGTDGTGPGSGSPCMQMSASALCASPAAANAAGNIQLADTHLHLQPLQEMSPAKWAAQAQKAGLSELCLMCTVSGDLADLCSVRAALQAQQLQVYLFCGCHPCYLTKACVSASAGSSFSATATAADAASLSAGTSWPALSADTAAAAAAEVYGLHNLPGLQDAYTACQCCGLGEVGLDGTAAAPMEQQVSYLQGVLDLAAELHCPVSLHCYKAHEPLLRLLRRYCSSRQTGQVSRALQQGTVTSQELTSQLPFTACLHGATGSPELMQQYLRLGVYLGLGKLMLNEHNRLRRALPALPAVFRQQLLFESDCDSFPYPFYLPHAVTDSLAQSLHLSAEAACELLRHNTRSFLNHGFALSQ